jgi:hypothetical protein
MDELQIFDFERDFAGSLRCIPMIVRFKLDLVGVKLSLRQWSRFGHRDREQLVGMPCEMPDEVADCRAFLIFLIESFADEPVKNLEVVAHPEWSHTDRAPDRVVRLALDRGLEPPSADIWASWTPLQRFALFKLTRPSHDNDNFEPALQEFLTWTDRRGGSTRAQSEDL